MVFDPLSLKRRWCIRLSQDWTDINARLGLGLKEPGFGLLDSGKKYGHWDPNTSEIFILESLIEQHTWHVVLEVLKHEMSHQYVDQILKKRHVPPHGKEFQQACDIVGVHPDLRGRSGTMLRFLRQETGGEDRRSGLNRKIEKILSLASSSNENEAQAAMDKANALIAKYNLEILLSDDQEREYDYVQFRLGNKQIPRWKKTVVALINRFYFVQSIVLSQYDAKTDGTYKVVEFLGTSENLAVAVHAFSFLLERVEQFSADYKKRTGAKREALFAFKLGMVNGFSKKLYDADRLRNAAILTAANEATTSSLVIARDQNLARFYRSRYPQTRRQSMGRSIRLDASSYKAGRKEGQNLTIHNAVSEQDGNRGNLLP